jgi:dTMP kinase
MNRTDKGILIAFEGIDGAGKTTQVDLLAKFFASVGESAVCSKEPTDGPWGRMIRQSASNGRMTWREELNALAKDREQHVREVILPVLSRGMTVILDRYFYSTIAYQGSRGGNIASITSMMVEISPEPDIVVLIDVPPAVGLARIQELRGEKPNAFENPKTLKKVRQVFLQLAEEHPNILLIDGTPKVEVVHRAILKGLLDGVLKQLHSAKHYGCEEPSTCSHRAPDACRWMAMRRKADMLP